MAFNFQIPSLRLVDLWYCISSIASASSYTGGICQNSVVVCFFLYMQLVRVIVVSEVYSGDTNQRTRGCISAIARGSGLYCFLVRAHVQ